MEELIVNVQAIESHSKDLALYTKKATEEDLNLYDERIKNLYESESSILEAINNIKNNFIRIGFELWAICRKGFISIKVGNTYCHNFYDYARLTFGLKTTSVKNLIGVYEAFGEGTRYNSTVKSEFANFSYTQLVEMLSLSEEERLNIKPDMTIAQIRAYKQEKQSSFSGQLTDQTKSNSTEVDFEVITDIPKAELIVVDSADVKPCAKLSFKNDAQRFEWLDNYEMNCYLYVDVPALKMRVYRYDFRNDVSLYITEFGGIHNTSLLRQLISNDGKIGFPVSGLYGYTSLTANQIVDWIKKYREDI